jgi:hypothetical protein
MIKKFLGSEISNKLRIIFKKGKTFNDFLYVDR